MKKDICLAIALLCAATGTYAQPSVVLYGIIDESLAYSSSEASSATTRGQRNFKALTGELSGDRWGLRGAEDLGGGLKAVFTLENGFQGTTGKLAQGGLLFGRQAFVGLSSPSVGTFTMGRQYDFGYEFLGSFLAWTQFMGTFGAHVGDNDNLYQTIRSNNSVKYQSPTVHGVTFGVLYGFSNQASGTNGAGFANNRDYNVAVSYDGGPFKAGVSYMRLDDPSSANNTNPNGAIAANQYTLGASSIFYNTSPVTRQSVIAVGGTYAFSFLTVSAVFSDSTLDYLDGTRLRLDNYEINAKKLIAPSWLVGAGYTYTAGFAQGGMSIKPFATGNHPAWQQINLGTEYFLSKRTTLHLATVLQFATRDASLAAISFNGAVSGNNSYKQIAVVAGIRHTF
ncbi:porin [Burkholderia sp. PAMC 28687]|uniref:porin n=1 Tax=Burkholderia sp. PAMC 28687 TaxID=1795874 RepID=UPI0009EC1B38|nr:porin [Burkholderia sp. PAMC 28687]